MSSPEASMRPPLERFLETHPPWDVMDLWDAAVHDAFRLSGELATKAEASRLKKTFLDLRRQATSDLVSFHDEVEVTPYAGEQLSCPEGYSPWRVEFALTLLPKRPDGFSRVEVLLELYSSEGHPGGCHLLAVLPSPRSELQACEALRGTLQLDTGLRVAHVNPLPRARRAAEVLLEHYGPEGRYLSGAVRTCVAAQVRGPTGARWRLDAASPGVGAESHRLTLVVAVKTDAPALHVAASLMAHSQENWLDAYVGSFWRDFETSVREFLLVGAPARAHGEWLDVIGPAARE
ncbi:hypothetical protein LXT21_20450 [Myxococcus sp. K38C18041901]|uniref:hypothetical protein n=1 Tax=Myxococcus guangdongensis TaxID=2906760 RepID=UPI0020A7F100|nr:hypothetical protein [Myxococcus guangdongensis]MCP3061155.1 hypothetical protein [Myxococcus guangdongensis]